MSTTDDSIDVNREFTAHTADQLVWVRVLFTGRILGVQVEPAEMRRPGWQIAARIQACSDVAYLEGQVYHRKFIQSRGASEAAWDWMASDEELAAARDRLSRL